MKITTKQHINKHLKAVNLIDDIENLISEFGGELDVDIVDDENVDDINDYIITQIIIQLGYDYLIN